MLGEQAAAVKEETGMGRQAGGAPQERAQWAGRGQGAEGWERSGGSASALNGVFLHLRNSPDWTMLFRRCSDIHIDRVEVFGDSRWPNNDGVDFESCSDIHLENSRFDTGDDGVVFSSGNTNVQRIPFRPQPPPPTERAVVRNVFVRSHSSAIKFEVGEERKEKRHSCST